MDVPSAGGVNPENQGANMENAQNVQAKPLASVKNIIEMMPGEVFSAEILDIQPGIISLKMGEGILNARSLSAPDARIGDKATFVVKDASPGHIMLEFLRGPGGENTQVSASIVKEALSAANMQHTSLNSQLIENLVTHNMPIDFSSVQRAAYFQYSMPDAPFSHITFLLENNFAPTERSVQMFQGIVNGELNLKEEAANLLRHIETGEFQNPSVKEGLTNILNKYENLSSSQSLALDVQSGDLGRYLTELRVMAEEMGSFMRQAGEDAPAVRQSLENISDIIDFARNIGETKMYYQFPFVIDQKENSAELHVFKRKGQRKGGGKNASALIALDMAQLGRVEVLVNKNGRDVNVQFRSDMGRTLSVVNGNGHKLSDLLGDKGFLLTGLSVKMIEEKFDLVSANNEKKPLPKNIPDYNAGAKRYSFDMRV